MSEDAQLISITRISVPMAIVCSVVVAILTFLVTITWSASEKYVEFRQLHDDVQEMRKNTSDIPILEYKIGVLSDRVDMLAREQREKSANSK